LVHPWYGGPAASENQQAILDCDLLAASPDDPQSTAPGIKFDDIDASAAVVACSEAVSKTPLPRVEFQYA
jgi:hypothetical protein